jgi:hypothetical protein
VPIVQPIGRQRGISAPLLLVPLLWIGGCQSLGPGSDTMVGPETRWRITGQAGLVALRSPAQSFWQRAIPGVRIAPDSEIATFDGSRLELASAGDKVTASGASRFTLPTAEQDGVRVRQDAGSLHYKVQSAPNRRFEVKTPHFSTVVKGTSFLVFIDRDSSAVVVDEGRVLILDPNGERLGELTAGQIGRMAGQPGAALEVSTAAEPTFESAEPRAGGEASAHGDTNLSRTTNGTGVSLSVPTNDASSAAAEPSFFQRIESFFGDLAVQLSSEGALTGRAVDLDSGPGGGAREQANQSNHGNLFDGSPGNENGKGKGGGKSGKGNGKGNGKGKGNGNGKGNGGGRGNGRGHGHGKGAGGGSAQIILDDGDRGHLIAWSTRQ